MGLLNLKATTRKTTRSPVVRAAALRDELALWPQHWREAFEERAANLKAAGGIAPDEVDRQALAEVLARPPAAVFPLAWNEEWLLERGLLRGRLVNCPDLDLRRRILALVQETPRTEAAWLELGRHMVTLEGEVRRGGYLHSAKHSTVASRKRGPQSRPAWPGAARTSWPAPHLGGPDPGLRLAAIAQYLGGLEKKRGNPSRRG